MSQTSTSATAPSRTAQDEKLQFKTIVLLLLLVTAIGWLLRSYGLDKQSLWMDEIVSLMNADILRNEGLKQLADIDHTAPLHVILLWLVTLVSAPTETAVRIPSVIFGAAVVPVLGWLIYDMFRSSRLAVVGSLLMCFSPYAIWYSQEARMYSLYLFFSVLFVALSWRASERPVGPALWISLAGVSMLGLYSHHFMLLLIFAFGLYLLGRWGLFSARLWWWASAQALAFGGFLYWIYLTFNHLGAPAGVAKPLFAFWIPYTLTSFSFGPTLGPSIADIREAGIGSLLSYQGVLAGSAALCAVYVLYCGLREILKEDTRRAGIWCIIWMVVPISLAILATQISNITYNPRYVIASLPALVIVMAAGVVSIMRTGRAARGAVIALVAFTAIALFNLYWNPAYAREELRPIARMLRTNFSPDDVLVVANGRMLLLLEHYGAGTPSHMLYVPCTPLGCYNLHHTVAQLEQVIRHSKANVWLVQYRTWEADPDRVLQATLDRLGRIKEEHSWPGVSLRIYGPGSSAANNSLQLSNESATSPGGATPPTHQPIGTPIPADRATAWNPGLNAVGGIPMRATICATVNASTYGNGAENAARGIQTAIDNCPVGQVVMLSAGEFKITNRIMVNKGITLRGRGPAQTKLKMPPGISDNIISIGTEQWVGVIHSTNLASDAVKGSQSVTLERNPGLTVGEIIQIDQLTDPALVSWGANCKPGGGCRGWFTRMDRPLGQVMEIASISGNTITFTTPFHIDFKTAHAAQLSRFGEDWSGRLIPSVKYAGVEDLYLSGGSTGGQGNINMRKAAYSWIKNIESDYHGGHSVALSATFRSVVRDSYIHSAQQSVPGGGAYGLVVSSYSSDNLIENNIVWRMNKLMVMQSSGGGNVIAYNYMDDGHIEHRLSWMESGINASHMAGSHMVLFEGNQSFSYDAENDWGGPIYITVFRNHLTGKRRSTPPREPTPDPSLQFPSDQFRRAVGIAASAWWHTLVGNVLGHAGMKPAPAKSFKYEDFYPWRDDPVPMWRVGLGDNMGPPDPKVVSTLVRGGNYDYATKHVHWENVTPQTLPDSLYLTSKPAFFGTCTWPWVDPTGSTKTHVLPARARFDAGTPNSGAPCGATRTP